MDWQALTLSVQLALTTMVVLLPAGLLGARWLARSRSSAKPWVEALVMLPLVLPPTVLGYYLLVSLGAPSPLGRWAQDTLGLSLTFNFLSLLVASVVFNIPFMLQPMQRAFEGIPHKLIEAATVNGLGAWATFWRVELPLAWPGVMSALMLTFVHTLGEFGVVLMVGGNIPGETRTIAIAIYDRVQAFDLQAAHLMSLSLLAFSTLAIVATLWAGRRTGGAHQ